VGAIPGDNPASPAGDFGKTIAVQDEVESTEIRTWAAKAVLISDASPQDQSRAISKADF